MGSETAPTDTAPLLLVRPAPSAFSSPGLRQRSRTHSNSAAVALPLQPHTPTPIKHNSKIGGGVSDYTPTRPPFSLLSNISAASQTAPPAFKRPLPVTAFQPAANPNFHPKQIPSDQTLLRLDNEEEEEEDDDCDVEHGDLFSSFVSSSPTRFATSAFPSLPMPPATPVKKRENWNHSSEKALNASAHSSGFKFYPRSEQPKLKAPSLFSPWSAERTNAENIQHLSPFGAARSPFSPTGGGRIRELSAPGLLFGNGETLLKSQDTVFGSSDELEDLDVAKNELNDPDDVFMDDYHPSEKSFSFQQRVNHPSPGEFSSDETEIVMDESQDVHDDRITPTAELMDFFSSSHTDASRFKKTPDAYSNTNHSISLLPSDTPPVGGMVGIGGFANGLASKKADNFEYAHMLHTEGLKMLKACKYEYPPIPLESKPIPHDHLTKHYKLLYRLGRGAFADVFKIQQQPRHGTTNHHHSPKNKMIPNPAERTPTHTSHHHPPTFTFAAAASSKDSSDSDLRYFALKKTRNTITGPRDRRDKIEELVILHKLEGKSNVVQIHEAWEQYGCLYFVLEFCEGGDLAGFLDSKMNGGSPDAANGVALAGDGGIQEIVIWAILGQVSQGLCQIHGAGIIHLDLKPSNIMIAKGGVLKIGDFGCATQLPVPDGFEREGDRTYIAPEVMESKYGPECDIFSLGLIIFEISTNVILPENGSHWQKLRRHDFSECEGGSTLNRVSPPLADLIKGMLHPDRKLRIRLERILGHPFVGAVLEGQSLFG
ncbi:hypothetical protein CcCBS67573_g03238 [Chytriomyces confervae]|uniref:Protein kinase domain-containing protein n=1 Tax=Chytriomyces confervae TaxID=246404 RepID=A0A507FH31_9FUNG|nr:hypothetical protein CcCBS67573_g03238 [Chytriomyces confervae]